MSMVMDKRTSALNRIAQLEAGQPRAVREAVLELLKHYRGAVDDPKANGNGQAGQRLHSINEEIAKLRKDLT